MGKCVEWTANMHVCDNIGLVRLQQIECKAFVLKAKVNHRNCVIEYQIGFVCFSFENATTTLIYTSYFFHIGWNNAKALTGNFEILSIFLSFIFQFQRITIEILFVNFVIDFVIFGFICRWLAVAIQNGKKMQLIKISIICSNC